MPYLSTTSVSQYKGGIQVVIASMHYTVSLPYTLLKCNEKLTYIFRKKGCCCAGSNEIYAFLCS
jgi:hypothetical protein